jgi:HAE1 family hydrophobic/amphiphilic exporter-1
MSFLQILHLAVFAVLLMLVARRLPKFAIGRPVAFLMILFLTALVGLIGLKQLPVELMPNIAYGNVTIFIDVRGGMPPPEIERLVTKPVEEAMMTVSKLRNIIASSKKNRAVITLEFEPGMNMNLATLEVREKFLRIKNKLPKEIERPVIAHYEESDAPVVIAALTSPRYTPEELRRIVEEKLKEKIIRTEGVANVEIGGGRERKILVELDKAKLVAFNLPMKKIVGILEQNNLNLRVGEMTEASQNLGLRAVGAFQTVEDIGNVGVAVTEKGGLIRLKDLGEVKDDYMDAESLSRLNSKAAVTLYIQKESAANTVRVVERVKKVLDDFRGTLGEDIQLLIVSDQGRAIENAIRSVEMTMFFGVALVVLILSLFLSETFFTRFLSATLLIVLFLVLVIFFALHIQLENSMWIVIVVLLGLSLLAIKRGDLRPAFVVAGSIPVSLLITLAWMYFEKVSINVISLSGLVLGTGLLVDNSIVVLENFDRLRRKDPSVPVGVQVERAVQEVVGPMLGGTLTTVVVFVPFTMLQKQTQLLYAGIAFTVTATLLSSLFSAVTLIPALAAHLKKSEEVHTGFTVRLEQGVQRLLASLRRVFQRVIGRLRAQMRVLAALGLLVLILGMVWGLSLPLDTTAYILAVLGALVLGIYLMRHYTYYLKWFLGHKKILLGTILVLFASALLIFVYRLPKDFMAASEESEFVVFVELASGTRINISDQVVKEVEKRIRETPEVKDMIQNLSTRVEGWSSKVYVTLKPRAERALSTQAVIDKLRPRLKHIGEDYDTFVYFSEPRSGKEIFIEVYGENYKTLSQLAMQIASGLSKIHQLSDVKVRYRPGQPEATVQINPARAAMLGFDNQEIAESLHGMIRGLRATSFFSRNEEVETVVRLKPNQIQTVEQLKGLPLASAGGFFVPLEQVASLEFGLSPSEIWHRNKTRMIQVSANLGSMPLGAAATQVQKVIQSVKFPEEYYADIGGDYENMVQSSRSFSQALMLTFILIFVVMACQFESYSQPFIIMITIALSSIGAVAALAISKSTVTLGVSIGMLMLGGMVVNSGIILVDRINNLRRFHPQISVEKIIIWAGKHRMRPIFMTMATTVCGLLPMGLDHSESSVLWSPLAITVIGGLISSAIFTLFVVPCFYLVFEKIKKIDFIRLFQNFFREKTLKNKCN